MDWARSFAVSWSARSRRGERAESIWERLWRRQTRKSEPRAPSRALFELVDSELAVEREVDVGGFNSGATLRSQLIVRIALASFKLFPRRLAIKFVHISCIAVSAWRLTLVMRGEAG